MSDTDPVLPVTQRTRQVLVVLLSSLLLAAASPVGSEAASGHPAVAGVRVIGHTVQGQNIVAWRLGQPTARRKVVILSAMHGDETGPARILYNLRDGRAIRGADIWVVPQYNRDGIRRHTRQNAHGVDLNRNYPRHWKRQTGATNSGPRAASEPETRAVMAFLRRIRPDYVVSFHQPLYGVGRTDGKGGYFVQRLHRGLGPAGQVVQLLRCLPRHDDRVVQRDLARHRRHRGVRARSQQAAGHQDRAHGPAPGHRRPSLRLGRPTSRYTSPVRPERGPVQCHHLSGFRHDDHARA